MWCPPKWPGKNYDFFGHIVPNCHVYSICVGIVDKVYMSLAYAICLSVFLSSFFLCVPGFSAAFPARDEILQQWKSNFQLPCEVLFHGWLQSHCLQPCIRGLQYLQEALPNGLCYCPLLNCYLVSLSSLALFSFSSSLQSRHNFRDLKELKIDENFFGLG